ncbi:nucleotide disphospho-sugar-binding domain-containing protein [Sciscionella sediminilitoris]|uniref:nucleotide disphospho-sugar-binding domain-containing protein n=1 Tax=Sciscionella sediminilitoris TaxID=1445613 RepID=UPI0004DF379E|nr:nucleotide disphospho-sugar-binding domain-containing protein [Sciscionella sp. SE31]
MRILFTAMPGYGLTLPLVPLAWAARAAGHEVLFASAAPMAPVLAEAGLTVADTCPGRDIWAEFTKMVMEPDSSDMSEELRAAAGSGAPFGFFALTMTGRTIECGRDFGADLVVYTSDHMAGPYVAAKLGVPALEAGNRVSWSMRDKDFRDRSETLNDTVINEALREKHGITGELPEPVARIDLRAPSMGGISAEEPDHRDGRPWWPMRYVPYNGGVVAPAWALGEPKRPRVLVTLGTVVPIMAGVSNLSVVLEALAGLDVDVILAAGSADLAELGELPDNVHSAGFLPLSAILPRCSLIVHHGGSGTTAAPLAYGVPQFVLPSFADNPMSADRVTERGVGLQHDPVTVTVEQARTAIERLLGEPEFAERAREVATEMAGMPSPAAVIGQLEVLLAG